MTAPREALVQSARQWAQFADEDLLLAVHARTLEPPVRPNRLIAYHAQQCAEKYLKAFLVSQGIDFPLTHNIARLLELCERRALWTGELVSAAGLTTYAITTRYPGIADDVSIAEADGAVKQAKLVRRVVREALEADGVQLVPNAPGIE